MGFAPLTQLCELNVLRPLLLKSHFNWEATGLPGLSDPLSVGQRSVHTSLPLN